MGQLAGISSGGTCTSTGYQLKFEDTPCVMRMYVFVEGIYRYNDVSLNRIQTLN